MTNSPTVLSTKVLHTTQRDLVKHLDIQFVERDYIQIRLLDFRVDQLYDYLLITSQNAVKSLLQHERHADFKQIPVFCVGIKTKALLEACGWHVVAWAHYAVDLAPIIIRDYPNAAISFFNGNLRSTVLPIALEGAKMKFNEFQVYQTALTSEPLTIKLDGICFYSPSGVYSYLQQNEIGDEVCFCIGKTTADALEGITKRLILATHPTVEATLEACVTYYK